MQTVVVAGKNEWGMRLPTRLGARCFFPPPLDSGVVGDIGLFHLHSVLKAPNDGIAHRPYRTFLEHGLADYPYALPTASAVFYSCDYPVNTYMRPLLCANTS